MKKQCGAKIKKTFENSKLQSDEIVKKLFSMQDKKYREFQCSLMPSVQKEKVIGIRTPLLREYAKKIAGTEEAELFIADLPHTYYEENNLHAFLLEKISDYETAVNAVTLFLPYVDNWATCDSMNPKVFKKHTEALYKQIKVWIKSKKTYTVRFGLGMLMRYFLDDDFTDGVLELASSVRSEEYYVRMMQAWFFATALAKQWNKTVPYIKKQMLDEWVLKKTIQKACESFRVSDEHKALLHSYSALQNL